MFKYRQFMFILRHLSQITHHFTHFEHADNKKNAASGELAAL